MSLAAGSRLGPYEILSALGAGGMGEVYRARDTKLNRDVALKVLPDSFATDPDRLTRFQREAQVLASLNHPNIAHIHGLEDSGGVRALVMELVEGEDLAQRLTRGAIPVDEALPIAKQIAEALEAAHEQGIIHRDLKPANIKLRPDGTVKVLDFGLAKALETTGTVTASVSMSPTITTPAMTQAGIILGTAAYMSPEQARGKPVDRRTDIWAFGAVLFEMLTGRRAFEAEDVSLTLAEVMKSEPDWSALPPTVPPDLRRLLLRCLEKDPKRRLQAMGDARIEIADLSGSATHQEPLDPVRPRHQSLWQGPLPWFGLAATLGVALTLAVGLPSRKGQRPLAAIRLSAELGANVSLVDQGNTSDAILAPDDSVLAFVARSDPSARPQLYLRSLNRAQPTALSGTEGAYGPFFSPDSHWIGFFADDKLKKIAVSGGAAITLSDAPAARGGTWADDGSIVFAPDVRSVPNVPLQRVSSGGGETTSLTTLAEGEATQRYPQILPGGHAVLFTSSGTIGAFDDANLVVVTLATGARTVVQRGGYQGRYLPSGHLVYVHEGTLFATPFDLGRLEVTGPPIPVLEGVRSSSVPAGAEVAVSASGTLVYVPGQTTGGQTPVSWLDRDGKTALLRATPANWSNLQFAPDDHRLALEIADGQDDIWIYEWERDTLTRLTSTPASDRKPVWTPDGQRVTFTSTRADRSTPNLYWQRADGTGEVQRLTQSKNPQLPSSWHPDGRVLAFEEQNPQTGYDVMLLPMEGDFKSGWKPGKPTAFLNSGFAEREPMFAPNGRWLAYSSNESGRDEVYVRPFPGPGSKWQISTGGGFNPTWSRTKQELLYQAVGVMVANYVVEGGSFRAEKPRPWPNGRYAPRGSSRMFDMHPDGERLAFRPATQSQSNEKLDHITFIFNFFDELRRIAPESTR